MQKHVFSTGRGPIVYWTDPCPGSQITLVFLPGLTADHTLFQPQLEAFRGRYSLLTWDAPGHGASRPFPLDFSLEEQAAWLHAILLRESIRSFCLIGQSMGGYTAQVFLARYPGEARGFIAIDSAPIQRRYTTAAELWMLRHCEGLFRLYPWSVLRACVARGCACTEAGQAFMHRMMDGYPKEYYCALTGHGYRILAQTMAHDLPEPLRCPTLLLCGRKDRAGLVKRYNRAWAKKTGLPLVWLPGAGHNSPLDCPQAVQALIEGFLNELPPATAEAGVR